MRVGVATVEGVRVTVRDGATVEVSVAVDDTAIVGESAGVCDVVMVGAWEGVADDVGVKLGFADLVVDVTVTVKVRATVLFSIFAVGVAVAEGPVVAAPVVVGAVTGR